MSTDGKFKPGDKVVIVDEGRAREWLVSQDLIEKLTPLQPLTVSETNTDGRGVSSVCLQEDEYSYNWPVSALAHAPATYANTQSLHVQGRLKSDGDKWFDLFYLAMSQGHTIDKSAEMADHAYFEYEKRVEGR